MHGIRGDIDFAGPSDSTILNEGSIEERFVRHSGKHAGILGADKRAQIGDAF
jgi:hypothetical protein